MKPYYEDDAVTIYHADCRDVLPTLGPVDLVLTDPPYGISFASQPTKWQRLAKMNPADWDEERPDLTPLILAPSVCIWGGNYFPLPVSRGWFVWIKPDAPPSMGGAELAWTNRDANTKYISQSIGATNAERLGHPTQKPLRVMKWCVEQFPDAPTILDPFMGSGTTLRAAKDLGRKAIGIEIEEKYCEIAAKRMSQMVMQL